MSTVEIERRARAAGIRISHLLAIAGVHRESWRMAKRNPAQTRRSTLERLASALERLGRDDMTAPGLVATVYRTALGAIAAELMLDPDAIAAAALDFSIEKPNSPAWLALARARQLAIYVVTVELEVSNAVLARAIGCTRQNVKKARNAVELRREDPAIDALIAGVARRMGR